MVFLQGVTGLFTNSPAVFTVPTDLPGIILKISKKAAIQNALQKLVLYGAGCMTALRISLLKELANTRDIRPLPSACCSLPFILN